MCNNFKVANIVINFQDIFLPTNNRYIMYASKSKKVKPAMSTARSPMNFSKTKGNGKYAPNVNVNHHQCSYDEQAGKIQTMFESQVCLGCSEKSLVNITSFYFIDLEKCNYFAQ